MSKKNVLQKMSPKVTNELQNIIETAKLLKVEAVVIDELGIRGQNDEGILIIQNTNLPELPFDAIAFGDIEALQKRISLFDDCQMMYELKTQRSGYEYPYKLVFKSNTSKSSVEYTCTIPTAIRVPDVMRDPISFSFSMNVESVDLLVKSNRVMGASKLLLSSANGKVVFKISDVNGNILKHRITTAVVLEDEHEFGDSFAFPYKINNVIPILRYLAKQYDEFDIGITSRGFLSIIVNDLNIYILREKE